MDPPAAAALLTEAALLHVTTAEGPVQISNLGSLQEAFVRGSKSRDPAIQVAKRFLKVRDALLDLEKALVEIPARKGLVAPPKAGTPPSRVDRTGLEIVPYVDSVPPPPARPPRAQEKTDTLDAMVAACESVQQLARRLLAPYFKLRSFL